MTDCIFDYLYKEAGCIINWLNKSTLDLPTCEGVEDIKRLSFIMWNLHSAPYSKLSALTGWNILIMVTFKVLIYMKLAEGPGVARGKKTF